MGRFRVKNSKNLLSIVIFILLFSWTPIFIKILSHHYNIITQNFYRFLFADIFLLSLSYYLFNEDLKRALKNIRIFIFPGLLAAISQNLLVAAISTTTAVLGGLLSKLSVVFTVLLSLVFLKSERKIIKSRYFLIGLSLAILGFIGVILGKGELAINDFNIGILIFIITAFLVGLYRVSIKNIVKDINPLVSFSIICVLMTVFFTPFVILFGDLGRIFEVEIKYNLILFFSGFISISLANTFFFKAVKDFGVSLPNTLFLMLPFTTGIFSFLFLGELLTAIQVFSGLILIMGCFLLMRAKRT